MNQHTCARRGRKSTFAYPAQSLCSVHILQRLTALSALCRVLVLLLSALICVAAQAATVPSEPVFGPKVYTRGAGSPVTVTDTFAIPAGIAAPFLLRIENGDPAVPKAKPVTSATLRLNGVQILGPSDFNGPVVLIERTMTLIASNNTLAVTVTEPSGGGFRLRILGTQIPTVPTGLAPNPITITTGAISNLTASLSPAPTSSGSLTLTSANPGIASVVSLK